MTTDTAGSTAYSGASNTGMILATKVVASASGTLSSLGINLKTAAGNIRIVLYSSVVNGVLSGIIGQTADTPAAVGFNYYPAAGGNIVAGTAYYLGAQCSDPSTSIYFDGTGAYYIVPNITYGAFPDPTPAYTGPGAGSYNVGIQYSSAPPQPQVFDHFLVNGSPTPQGQNPITVTGITADVTIIPVYVPAPITTYILNWAITPTKGNLPFTVTFSGYLSENSSAPDTSTLINGETIKLQIMGPGSSTWTDTGVTATTATGPLGTGYFSGTWQLKEPGIYPGPWQFRTYYAGNVAKNMFGCDNRQKKRDLRRVNALLM